MAIIRFYLYPTADTIYDEHFVPFYGTDRPFYYVQMNQAVPSADYNWQQYYFFDPGQESYPLNFFCRGTGIPNIYRKSHWITQGTDLYDALQAENCNRLAAGTWRVALYMIGMGAIQDTPYYITFYVYLRNGVTETLLFSWQSSTFNTWDDPELFDSPSESAQVVTQNDRLVLKAYCSFANGDEDGLRLLMGKSGVNEYYGYIEFTCDSSAEPLSLVQNWKLGEMKITDQGFTGECRGRAQRLQQNIIELYTPVCRADLGDTRCGIDLDDSAGTYRYSGAVTSVTEDRYEFIDTNTPSYAGGDVFTGGLLVWSEPASSGDFTGDNAGYQMEVKKYDSSTNTYTLFEPMPHNIQVDDEFTVYFGCDKTPDTCKGTFDNIENFRGEPYIPGIDGIARGRT